ncbi:MAG: HEPN domain-containing protein [bacterium]
MPNRHQDWLKQALSDLKHSKNTREDGNYECACFAAQQASEKAVNALIEFFGGEGGHAISKMLEEIKTRYEAPLSASKMLSC